MATPAEESATPLPAPTAFFDDRRLLYEPGFYAPQIQAFLDAQPGPLKRLTFQVGDRQHSFAESLVSQSTYYGFNPKVVLALLELQSGLVSNPNATAEQLNWAAGFRGERGNWRGLNAQTRWVLKQIVQAKRDYPSYAPLTYADGSSVPPPPDLGFSAYVVARLFAPTTTPGQLVDTLRAFRETYTRLFDDPRTPPANWPNPSEPFLFWPLERQFQVTSFFDHGGPFLTRNARAGMTTYWGRTETDIAFAYNGHDGWDYAAAPPSPALAAADGVVVFAGNANDNCATRAVVLDHNNGYRTLYWHLAQVDVANGDTVARGQPLGIVGESGCALGPHLHFGVQFLGRNIDPYGWCGGDVPDPWAEHPAGTVSTWLWADRPSPCGSPPEGAAVVDDEGAGFNRAGDGWQRVPSGYGGGASFIRSIQGTADQPWELRPLSAPAIAVYRPALPASGRYQVLAYVPYALNGLEDSRQVQYRVRHSDGDTTVTVDAQTAANDWADLGTYEFSPDAAAVTLTNLAEDNQRGIWADAVMWVPATQPLSKGQGAGVRNN
jgi:murein DD-endopeptidase MepM/ murein hydrolase activator NlpD